MGGAEAGGEGRGWGFVVGEDGCGGKESQCCTTPCCAARGTTPPQNEPARRLPIADAGNRERSGAEQSTAPEVSTGVGGPLPTQPQHDEQHMQGILNVENQMPSPT